MTGARTRNDPTRIALMAAAVSSMIGAGVSQSVLAGELNQFGERFTSSTPHPAKLSTQRPARLIGNDSRAAMLGSQNLTPIGLGDRAHARFQPPALPTDEFDALNVAGDAMRNTVGVVGQNLTTARHGVANVGNAVVLRIGPVHIGGALIRR
jgi:hypothetical protein